MRHEVITIREAQLGLTELLTSAPRRAPLGQRLAVLELEDAPPVAGPRAVGDDEVPF